MLTWTAAMTGPDRPMSPHGYCSSVRTLCALITARSAATTLASSSRLPGPGESPAAPPAAGAVSLLDAFCSTSWLGAAEAGAAAAVHVRQPQCRGWQASGMQASSGAAEASSAAPSPVLRFSSRDPARTSRQRKAAGISRSADHSGIAYVVTAASARLRVAGLAALPGRCPGTKRHNVLPAAASTLWLRECRARYMQYDPVDSAGGRTSARPHEVDGVSRSSDLKAQLKISSAGSMLHTFLPANEGRQLRNR